MTARDKGPTEVRLVPTARVHGEIVKPGGSPAIGGQVLPYVLLDNEQTDLKSNDDSQPGARLDQRAALPQ